MVEVIQVYIPCYHYVWNVAMFRELDRYMLVVRCLVDCCRVVLLSMPQFDVHIFTVN